MVISLNKKTGFKGINPVVYDKRGEFYSKQGEVTFNLPAGDYDITNAEQLSRPVKYRLPGLPFPERVNFLPNLDNVKISFENFKYKGAIDIWKNEIYLNEMLRNATTPKLMCVLMHEIGHYFYNTEKYCDLYAIRELVRCGMNPSQFVEFIYLLGECSEERKENATAYAEKIDERTSSNRPARLGRLLYLF